MQTSHGTAPVFIVGCARSGTTLLQSLLASHPEIVSFPESKFFVDLVRMPEERSRRYALGMVSKYLRPTLELFLDEVEHPELKRKLPRLPLVKLYLRSFRTIMAELTQLQGKRIWLEKTPEHLHRLKYVERYMPEAKIIHIVRSGVDVVASLYDLGQRHPNHWGLTFKNEDTCIQRWSDDIAITHQYLSHPNHTLIRYEHLVANPTDEIQRLCSFIGVPFDARMIENYRNMSNQLVRSHETWKASTQQAIQNTNSQKFLTVFTPEQQDYVRQAVNAVELPTLQTKTPLAPVT
ncbi:sulfotransferase family protein [Leptothoe sp. PORK10 BA2]|uniref:sulfotransferase family protein n=1 Tax=Leptothoe sp. PORK10 BA2 TaxID=3110254 RepID=UPI002B202DD1|nr:sulfotransferase [Leptothoe sp. PORK10 BA2]MEA5466001.1 sulfotransferase [Leptothoe sp. PORK10 BA2]